MVEALTDNRNRTAGVIRAAFSKNGGALGETGSVSFMFDRVGEVEYPVDVADSDKMILYAIEAGADDVQSDEETHVVICAFEDLAEVSGALQDLVGEAAAVRTVWRPQTCTAVDEDKGATLMKLIDVLEDDDDVQNVFANYEMSDEVMEKLAAA